MSTIKELTVDEAGRVTVDLSTPDAAHLRSDRVQCLIDDEKVVLRPAEAEEFCGEGGPSRPARPSENTAPDDFAWWSENLAYLRERYAGRWIAIRDQKVVAAAESPEAAQKMSEDGSEAPLIDFIPKREEIETKATSERNLCSSPQRPHTNRPPPFRPVGGS